MFVLVSFSRITLFKTLAQITDDSCDSWHAEVQRSRKEGEALHLCRVVGLMGPPKVDEESQNEDGLEAANGQRTREIVIRWMSYARLNDCADDTSSYRDVLKRPISCVLLSVRSKELLTSVVNSRVTTFRASSALAAIQISERIMDVFYSLTGNTDCLPDVK